MTRLALAIPHTPWVPERVASMDRLRSQLGTIPASYRVLTDRAPNAVWSLQMWDWLAGTRADWCVTLQDDVEVADCFWPALTAMLGVLDGVGARVCGLSSVHPMQVEMARQGQRWYRTRSWLVGWAYAIRRDALEEFLAWRALNPELVVGDVATGQQPLTEDSLLNHWINVSGHDTWHPVPTLVDHDTTIESTYGNNEHVHRRPWITWRDFTSGSLTTPEFWRPGGPPESVPLLPCPMPHHCWMCNKRRADVGATNGVRICRHCVAQCAGVLITRGDR